MHAVYVLWWVREKHVSVAAVSLILAAGDLAVTLLEVPTGWLADRFGHRVSLITGSLLQIAGMLFAWLGAGVPGVLASSLLIAAGDTFRSGADQALLYRSCAAIGEPAFQRIEARSRGLQLVALVALMLAGGAIVERWGFQAGWFAETLISAIGLAIACAMTEPQASLECGPTDEAGGMAFVEEERASAPAAPRRTPFQWGRSIVALILPAAGLGAFVSGTTFFVQSSTELESSRLTAFIALTILAEAAGAFAGSRLRGGVRAQLLLAGSGLGLFVAAVTLPSAFAAAVIALSFLMGAAHPMRAAAIQNVAADSVRAQAASLASAIDKGVMTVAITVAGLLPRRGRMTL